MILECQLETELLIDLLVDDQRSQIFWKRAEEQAAAIQSSSCKPNNKSKEYFGLDGELVNRLRPDLEKQYAGMRMAFCLGEPALPTGHLFPRQADSDLPVELPGDQRCQEIRWQLLSWFMNHFAMLRLTPAHSMFTVKRWYRPPLEILAELRAIEQEILQGIEELEGMLR